MWERTENPGYSRTPATGNYLLWYSGGSPTNGVLYRSTCLQRDTITSFHAASASARIRRQQQSMPSQTWSELSTYAFPPFAMVGRCLQMMRLNKQWWLHQYGKGKSGTQLEMLVDSPSQLPMFNLILTNPWGDPHPLVLQERLLLAAWRVSGIPSRCKEFQSSLWSSYVPLGEKGRRKPTLQLGGGGQAGVTRGVQIPSQPLWTKS